MYLARGGLRVRVRVWVRVGFYLKKRCQRVARSSSCLGLSLPLASARFLSRFTLVFGGEGRVRAHLLAVEMRVVGRSSMARLHSTARSVRSSPSSVQWAAALPQTALVGVTGREGAGLDVGSGRVPGRRPPVAEETHGHWTRVYHGWGGGRGKEANSMEKNNGNSHLHPWP